MWVGVAALPRNTRASKGRRASGLKPHPTNIYWYVIYIWLVFKALAAFPNDRITPETYLTALTIISTFLTTMGGFLTFTVNR